MQKKTKIILSVVIALIVICGGFYFYASHSVAKRLPGHVYEYTSVSGNRNAYMTFAKNGDQVVITPNKDEALKANNSNDDFQEVYQDNAKNGKWYYKAQGSKLTLSKLQDGKVSLWQYNRMLALGKKMRAGSFTYQIANAGQGVDHKATKFEQIH
ncbi:hypothetical protein H5S09_06660 [Limosilactobacillus sp. STM2_1]|uniref:Uncharacterized protein n=1 Tax=Limosilactobacillus rudii TaxID=2759755 RepID=A0A7W3YNG6_9LACO|nr:hypothetical protein [Limosilactobacillus rudii]MBB1079574.1 hypothetical protein [Limosilactobacillus rudii]MBB1097620.1 hypothetical protein [Limosilactobacillus rudii]MCD7134729.1 hypothetical protein [Limosilactobacillus rudii]